MARALTALLLALGVVALPATGWTAAPLNTKITAGPAGPIDSRTATFKFKSVRGATFQCRLDAASWSKCSSPKAYRKLTQGKHTFKVRAVKNGRIDRTPASRVFVVDTVAPETTISDGPTGTSEERTPTFTFAADEAATFACELADVVVDPCSSPFSPAKPLTDDGYTFSVVATDLAGNSDATPATSSFAVDTPMAMDLTTAEQAAELYFSDTFEMDVPAVCNTEVTVDCPRGTPAAPADQLRSVSTRVVALVDAQSDPLNHEYAVTVTSDVSTLQAIVATTSGVSCDLTLTSASGDEPTWQAVVPLEFERDPTTDERRIVLGDPVLSGIEAEDGRYDGGFTCAFFDPGPGFAQEIYRSALESRFSAVGRSLCAVPGPTYLGPCS